MILDCADKYVRCLCTSQGKKTSSPLLLFKVFWKRFCTGIRGFKKGIFLGGGWIAGLQGAIALLRHFEASFHRRESAGTWQEGRNKAIAPYIYSSVAYGLPMSFIA